MKHRHINTTEWTREAIDSALERGNLADWKELFKLAEANPKLARDILEIAAFHKDDGTFSLVKDLLESLQKKNIR